MLKHIIFLVHGMGEYKKGWSNEIQKLLRDELKNYLVFNDKEVEFVEIIYDDIFQSVRDKWKTSDDFNKYIKEHKLTLEAIDGLFDVNRELVKNNFATTHLLDVFLYRFVYTVTMSVRVSVAKQIHAKLEEDNSVKWSIIAHSLGTAVIQDTLYGLYNTSFDFNDNITKLKTADTRPTSVSMISNVSRVLRIFDINTYNPTVRPSADEEDGVCSRYLNIKHSLDLIAQVKPFNPDLKKWLDEDTYSNNEKMKYYQNIEVSEITDKDIHSLEHYLKNPKVHIPIFKAIFNKDKVDESKIKEYEDSAKKFELETLRNEIGSIIEDKSNSFKSLIDAILKMKKLEK